LANGAPRLLFTFEPHAHLTGLIAGLDVHDARATTHRAILGVGLALAAAQIDGQLVGLAAERALDDGGGTARALGHDA
jgi:hypothetical protein